MPMQKLHNLSPRNVDVMLHKNALGNYKKIHTGEIICLMWTDLNSKTNLQAINIRLDYSWKIIPVGYLSLMVRFLGRELLSIHL